MQSEKASRAELRRCRDATEVMFVPSFHRLLHRARESGLRSETRLAIAAGVLAHVRRHIDGAGPGQFARVLAEGSVAEPRFRRLLTIDDPAGLLVPLVRLIRLVDGAAPVENLARDIQFWGDEVKKRWAIAYYENY